MRTPGWQERLEALAGLLADQPQSVAGAVNFVYGLSAAARAEAFAADLRAAALADSSPRQGGGQNWWRPAARWVRQFDMDQTNSLAPMDRHTIRRLADGLDAGGASYEARVGVPSASPGETP